MGYSVRVDGWRLTQWVEWNGTALAPNWAGSGSNGSSGGVVAVELYDHRAADSKPFPTDFDATENANVAGDPRLPQRAATTGCALHHTCTG